MTHNNHASLKHYLCHRFKNSDTWISSSRTTQRSQMPTWHLVPRRHQKPPPIVHPLFLTEAVGKPPKIVHRNLSIYCLHLLFNPQKPPKASIDCSSKPINLIIIILLVHIYYDIFVYETIYSSIDIFFDYFYIWNYIFYCQNKMWNTKIQLFIKNNLNLIKIKY